MNWAASLQSLGILVSLFFIVSGMVGLFSNDEDRMQSGLVFVMMGILLASLTMGFIL